MNGSDDDLSGRALSFVRAHGHRITSDRAERSAAQWIEQGVDEALVDRAVEYERHWGDLYLPPALGFNGGPKYLGPDVLLGKWSDQGFLEAGPARFSGWYDFLVGPDGAFGLGDVTFVPLYQSIEAWIESVAFEHNVRRTATRIRKLTGPQALSFDLSGMSEIPGTSGISETWLMDDERIVFVSRGVSLLSGYPDDVVAIIYSDIPDRWANIGI